MWPFKKKATNDKPAQFPESEHSVIVYTAVPNVNIEQVRELSDLLRNTLTVGNHGELDGHEIALSGAEAIFYLYGPDARSLYSKIHGTLTGHEITQSGFAVLRFGDSRDPNVVEIQVNVSEGLPDVH